MEQVGVKLALHLFFSHHHLLFLPLFIYLRFPHLSPRSCVCGRLFPSPTHSRDSQMVVKTLIGFTNAFDPLVDQLYVSITLSHHS